MVCADPYAETYIVDSGIAECTKVREVLRQIKKPSRKKLDTDPLLAPYRINCANFTLGQLAHTLSDT